VKEILLKTTKKIAVTSENITDYPGVPKYRYGEAELEDRVALLPASPGPKSAESS